MMVVYYDSNMVLDENSTFYLVIKYLLEEIEVFKMYLF